MASSSRNIKSTPAMPAIDTEALHRLDLDDFMTLCAKVHHEILSEEKTLEGFELRKAILTNLTKQKPIIDPAKKSASKVIVKPFFNKISKNKFRLELQVGAFCDYCIEIEIQDNFLRIDLLLTAHPEELLTVSYSVKSGLRTQSSRLANSALEAKAFKLLSQNLFKLGSIQTGKSRKRKEKDDLSHSLSKKAKEDLVTTTLISPAATDISPAATDISTAATDISTAATDFSTATVVSESSSIASSVTMPANQSFDTESAIVASIITESATTESKTTASSSASTSSSELSLISTDSNVTTCLPSASQSSLSLLVTPTGSDTSVISSSSFFSSLLSQEVSCVSFEDISLETKESTEPCLAVSIVSPNYFCSNSSISPASSVSSTSSTSSTERSTLSPSRPSALAIDVNSIPDSKGKSSDSPLSLIELNSLMMTNIHSDQQKRFANIFFNHSFKKDENTYKQFIQFIRNDGKEIVIQVQLQFTSEFIYKKHNAENKDSQDIKPEEPSSWLFSPPDESRRGLRAKFNDCFSQVNPAYCLPKGSVPKYATLRFYEVSEEIPVAFIFAAVNGTSVELVNLAKGKHVAGKDIYHLSKKYMFGLFPASMPFFADMSYRDGVNKIKIMLKVIDAIMYGKTYYERIDDKVSLAPGLFHTYYYTKPIEQSFERRNELLKKIQNFPLKDWYRILPKIQKQGRDKKQSEDQKKFAKQKELLKELIKVYFDNGKEKANFLELHGDQTLKELVTRVFTARNLTHQTYLMHLLEANELDIWVDNKEDFGITKVNSANGFKKMLSEFCWGSLIWTINQSERERLCASHSSSSAPSSASIAKSQTR